MKTYRWLAVLIALPMIAALALAACGDDEEEAPTEIVQGSGNIITEEMPFADFTAVEAASAFDVEITQSQSFSVTIRVDDNIYDLLDVSKEGDTLRLGLERGVSLREPVTLEATVTMPDLDGLELSGASRAYVSGFRTSGQLDIKLSGASTLDGDLEAGSTDIKASGASRVELEGSATELTIEGSGASTLNLTDFAVETAEVRLSGASEATLDVRDRISTVDVSGASRLRYRGDPSLDDVHTSGGSTVDKIEN